MNNNYNIIRIQQYLNGSLSREEMYELEKEALNDPLLNDAVEGYRLSRDIDHGRLSLLQQRLAARIAGQQKERHTFYFSTQRLAIAATACVLMVLVLVLLWMRTGADRPSATEKEVAVELASPAAVAGIHAMPAAGGAYPQDGWERFNAYLAAQKSDRLSAGEIVVTFDIDPSGKPTAVRAVGEVSAPLFAEMQRLLQEGPTWHGTKAKITVAIE